jgi:hypothetical protein
MAAPLEISKPRNGYLTMHLNGERGSGIIVGIMPKEVDGKIAICGAVWPIDESRASKASQNHKVNEGVIRIKGNVMPARLKAFPFFETRSAVTTFRCSVSDVPWQGPYSSDDIRLRLPWEHGAD